MDERFAFNGSFMTKCNDKSGYDHILLSESSQTYFGFEWGGLWFECTTHPFRWKMSPYVYHTTGLKVSGLLREQRIPCSLYIDGRLNGELLTKSGPWSILYSDRRKQCRVKVVRAAIFIVF